MCGKTTNWKMRNVKEKRGIFIMKQKAMDMKLVVKPLVGCLTHTHFWEGPCRAGHKEDMTVEAETKAADEAFKNSVKGLQGVIDEVEFTEPVDVRYNESFVVDKDLFAKIDHAYSLGKKSSSQYKGACTDSRISAYIRNSESDPRSGDPSSALRS